MSTKEPTVLRQYDDINLIEIGLDEAGRGCLFGPVCVAGVIWPKKDPQNTMVIKDSKKCTEKYRQKLYKYIIENAISYSIHMIDHKDIDKQNILKCSIDGMHRCIDEITEKEKVDLILVDGNYFKNYYCSQTDDFIAHKCIVKGDNLYKSIAAASILAKTYRDNYIVELTDKYPELNKYGIANNKGYGTKQHMEAIKKYGISEWHRTSFAPCRINQKK